jgi:hypothetical protein
MDRLDKQISAELSHNTGLPYDLVHYLRTEFKKFGRNPLDSSIEILAIENGLSESTVKVPFYKCVIDGGDIIFLWMFT